MTKASPSTKSKRRLSPEERGRIWAKLAAECPVGIPFSSEAEIDAFAAELAEFFADWDAEIAQRKKAERKPRQPRTPSIKQMIERAEQASKPVTSITMPDGTKIDFNKPESSTEPNAWPLSDFNKETKQ